MHETMCVLLQKLAMRGVFKAVAFFWQFLFKIKSVYIIEFSDSNFIFFYLKLTFYQDD